jgi:thiamine-monophosphate kinase
MDYHQKYIYVSNVGCNLYEDKLPLDPQLINVCEEFDIDSTTVAINGGEDYELLFTIAMEDFDKIKGNPSIIGHNDRKVKEYI